MPRLRLAGLGNSTTTCIRGAFPDPLDDTDACEGYDRPLRPIPRPRAAPWTSGAPLALEELPPGARISGSGVSSSECTVICDRVGEGFGLGVTAVSLRSSSSKTAGGTVPRRMYVLAGTGDSNAAIADALVPGSWGMNGVAVRIGDKEDVAEIFRSI